MRPPKIPKRFRSSIIFTTILCVILSVFMIVLVSTIWTNHSVSKVNIILQIMSSAMGFLALGMCVSLIIASFKMMISARRKRNNTFKILREFKRTNYSYSAKELLFLFNHLDIGYIEQMMEEHK